jgi:peroxiredoxin
MSDGPLQPGDPAPDFAVAAINGDRTISLADYRSAHGLFLGFFRGLYCPFCRRSIAQMATSAEKLKPLGIESLAVVATELENARLYYRFRPVRLTIAVDPELSSHHSYGVPRLVVTPEVAAAMESVRINPTGELAEPMSIDRAAAELDRIDQFQRTDVDRRDEERQFPQLTGQFLIDPRGTIRWANVEGASEGPAGMGKFPTFDELRSAVERVRSS